MSAAQQLSVELLGRHAWERLLDSKNPENKTWHGLEGAPKRLATAILTALHDRHVGITPDLAAELALQLIPQPRAATGAWKAVLDRLREELAPPKEQRRPGSPPPEGFGLVLNLAPVYAILRLALPLVAMACQVVGRSVLFADDEQVDDPFPIAEYSRYASELEVALDRLTRDEALAPFWVELALTLHTLYHERRRSGRLDTPLPEADPVVVAWLTRLRPDPPPRPAFTHPPRRMTTSARYQKSVRAKEAGVEGIRVTRRLEDIGDILVSEFFNPPAMRADRLLNTGFLALDRPPQQHKPRDVLVAALVPDTVRQRAAAGFFKAAWFDAIWRFSAILRQHQLPRSEFRWIEGDSFGRARPGSVLLSDLPAGLGPAGHVSDAERRAFMIALRWLPGYVDTRDRFHAPAGPLPDDSLPLVVPVDPAVGETAISIPERAWLSSAWRGQQEHDSPTDGRLTGRSEGQRLRLDEFSYVHLMVFLPAPDELAPESAAQIAQHLRLALGAAASTLQFLTVTWVPDRPDTVPGWAFAGRGRVLAPLVPAEAELPTLPALAGSLEKAWLDQLIKDMLSV